MRQMLRMLALGVALLGAANAAAPPAAVYRQLTAAESQHITSLEKQVDEQFFKEAFEDAERLARQVLALRQRLQGNWHWATVDAKLLLKRLSALCKVPISRRRDVVQAAKLTARAIALQSRARYHEAERTHREALAIRKQVLGDEHPDTAQSYNNVAFNLHAQGKYTQAQPLFERALVIRKKAQGEEHPDIAECYNNLAAILRAQAKHAEAQRLVEKALAIRQKALGENHPLTAAGYNSVAAIMNAQGKYAEANLLYQRSLAIRRHVLGEDHHLTALSYTVVSQETELSIKFVEIRVKSRNRQEHLPGGDCRLRQPAVQPQEVRDER